MRIPWELLKNIDAPVPSLERLFNWYKVELWYFKGWYDSEMLQFRFQTTEIKRLVKKGVVKKLVVIISLVEGLALN